MAAKPASLISSKRHAQLRTIFALTGIFLAGGACGLILASIAFMEDYRYIIGDSLIAILFLEVGLGVLFAISWKIE